MKKNKTIYNKVKKSKEHYKVQMPIDIARDKNLGLIEIGIMYYCLASANSFAISKRNVVAEFIKRGNNRNQIEVAWNKLLHLGYIEIVRLGGKLGSNWIINEIPKK